MTNSADVAARAGVSRSTVSQILNGHGHRFKPDMVERVESAARELGYRPSLAGRALARGMSDIVITLLPNITLGPRLRTLIDLVTSELELAGKTNLVRLSSGDAELDDAVLAIRPAGLWSPAPLSDEQKSRLDDLGVRVVDQPQELQDAIDAEIGAVQAAHLIDRGYTSVAVAMPTDHRERPFALARERGALAVCHARGVEARPTLHLSLTRGSSPHTVDALPPSGTGVAAYNDDVALAMLSAASRAGRRVPADVGIIGVDNSITAAVTSPTLTTVDIGVRYSAHEIVRALLHGPGTMPTDPFAAVRTQISVVEGESSRRFAAVQ